MNFPRISCYFSVVLTLTFVSLQVHCFGSLKNKTLHILGYPEESLLNFTQYAEKIGLEAEEHEVKTSDGYLLKIFRVKKPGCKLKGLPVVLYHGLLLDASCWTAAGKLSPAYLIASDCFDVWLPNARGTRYSRTHTSLSPKKKEYWNFCVDEIGRYDVPAVVDYVLEHTKKKKLNYIGFSQGGGTFFVMCSEFPEYSKKIGTMIGLAPATRHLNSKSTLFRVVPQAIEKFETVLNIAHIYELFANGGPSQDFIQFFCPISGLTLKACDSLNNILGAEGALHPGSVNDETLKVISGTFPAGTSVHNLARYGQSLRSKEFQKFDYGKKKNKKLYGSEKPPIYNFSAVTAPVVIIYGANDGITDVEDVEWSINELPNVLESLKVDDPLWNHFDMTYSQYFKDRVYPKVLEHLRK